MWKIMKRKQVLDYMQENNQKKNYLIIICIYIFNVLFYFMEILFLLLPANNELVTFRISEV
jgi:hypothetical protein